MTSEPKGRVLIVAGSDSGGGASLVGCVALFVCASWRLPSGGRCGRV